MNIDEERKLKDIIARAKLVANITKLLERLGVLAFDVSLVLLSAWLATKICDALGIRDTSYWEMVIVLVVLDWLKINFRGRVS